MVENDDKIICKIGILRRFFKVFIPATLVSETRHKTGFFVTGF
jgi:hypothetical protein